MERELRNSLRTVVTACRKLIEDSLRLTLEGKFGIRPDGRLTDEVRLTHLSADELEFRRDLVTALQHIQDTLLGGGAIGAAAVEQLTREIGFTHLNRLCAYKMMAQRRLIRDAVGRGLNSPGFIFYLAEHPDEEQRWRAGDQETAYGHYLQWLAESFADEVGALFSPDDPANRLFPSQTALTQVLAQLNAEQLADVWGDDETIGWVYQYYTPEELRRRVRKESQAPRNSYELAFRN